MKKFSLFLLIALIIGSIFVSCSSDLETTDSSTAKVALNPSAFKALTVSVATEDLPTADQLKWYYTAVKNDQGFTTGDTRNYDDEDLVVIGDVTVGIPVSGDGGDGIPVRIGYSNADPDNSGTWFSTGEWKFSFYGVDVGNNKIIYSAIGEDVTVNRATEGNNVGGTANITLGLHNGDPRHACYVYINSDTGITVDLDKSFESGKTYRMEVYLDLEQAEIATAPIKTISGTQVGTSSEVTFKGTDNDNIIGSVTDLAAGFHTLTFKVFKGDIVYAEEAVDITVRKGVTWTISGSLDNLDAVAQVAINYQGISVVGFNRDDFDERVILIDSAEEFVDFANYVNDGHNCSGKTIYLTKDINISSIANWIPIGNSARKDESTDADYFAGTFDGGGHTIAGLKLTSETENLKFDANQTDASAPNIKFNEYIFGLFGTVKGATIKNLTLSDVSIANLYNEIDTTHRLTGENIGALIGYSEGSLTVDKITVESGSVAGSNVAGIIGRAYGKSDNAKISITNCENYANITSTNGSGNKAKAAGIVGYLSGLGAEVVVENCKNYGALHCSANKHAIAAGIVNYGFNNSHDDNYTVTNNTNSGAITLSSATGCLYAAISAECNDGKKEDDTITAKGNTNSGTITVNNAPGDEVLVRSSQNGDEVDN